MGQAATATAADSVNERRRPAASARGTVSPRRVAFLMVCGVLVGINLAGAHYYWAPLAVKMRHPMHAWLKPTGYIGQALGFLAAALFLFLWFYPLRKRLGSKLAFTGSMGAWLDWHVTAGLLVPFVAATHAGWRFMGMIGLGYAAMLIVFLSGLFGRYLYARIPRRCDGIESTRDEVATERNRLLFELTAVTGLSPDAVRATLARDIESCDGLGPLGTVWRMVADDFSRHRAARQLLRQAPRGKGQLSRLSRTGLRRALWLARREMALAQHLRMLEASRRVLRFWHMAHQPLAVTALLAVLAHVLIAVALGATWLH
ncbi:MAG: hypothetical protein ACE5HU_06955 [Acidobacteriota bacterium]